MKLDFAGAVLLECEEGCRCRKREYSLRHWNHVSLVYWKPLLEVSLDNSTDHCTVRVTNPVRNASDTKLKVSCVLELSSKLLIQHLAISDTYKQRMCLIDRWFLLQETGVETWSELRFGGFCMLKPTFPRLTAL